MNRFLSGCDDSHPNQCTIPPFLSLFDGQNPNGAWTLAVVDDLALDSGVLLKAGDPSGVVGWDTVFGTQLLITAVPEPAHVAILSAIGLSVFAAFRRRIGAKRFNH